MSEINDALGISDQPKQPKMNPIRPENHFSSVGDNIAESVLAIVAYGLLILGIIGSAVGGTVIGSGYHGNAGLGWTCFIGGSIISLIIWAICMVTVNISNNIRQIKHYLQNK